MFTLLLLARLLQVSAKEMMKFVSTSTKIQGNMIKNILFVLIILVPACLSAQPGSSDVSTTEKIIERECDGKMFTKVEHLPSFKISKQAFEDTLSQYLKARNAFYPNKKITFMFILTTSAQMLELEYISRNGPTEHTLPQAFL